MRIAVYPGSFDPFTNGHLDILQRSSKLFDEVVVGVLIHPTKTCLFSVEKRIEMIRQVVKPLKNVKTLNFDGLLVEFAKKIGACAIIRGLRAVSDYEYELQISSVNKQLAPDVETVFLMSATKFSFLSSSIVREVARYSGNVSDLVPALVNRELARIFSETPGVAPD